MRTSDRFRTLYTTVAVCLLWLLAAGQAEAGTGAPATGWKSLTSAHFIIHYRDAQRALAREALATAERVHERLTRQFAWTPAGRTDMVLADGMDVSNGYAEVFPTDRMTLFLTPPDDLGGLEDHGGWLDTLITHEYVHILHLDKASGAVKGLRRVFGRHPLLFPNAYQPTWLVEGIATYHETDRARGQGRGQSSYFDMLMRMEVARGPLGISQVNQPRVTWPAGITPYLYGVHFYDYLARQYGDRKIGAWVENYSDNVIPFLLNTTSGRSLGKRMTPLWNEFVLDLKAEHEPVLQRIRSEGVRAGERLTEDGYFTGATQALPDGRLLYIRNDFQQPAKLMLRRPGDGVSEPLMTVNFEARFDVHPVAGVVLAQPDLRHNHDLVFDLYRVDLDSGRTRRLTRGQRYRNATWSPDAAQIAAVRMAGGVARLDLLSRQGRKIETVWEGRRWEVIGDLDWSPDGTKIAAAVWRPENGWDLELFSLAEKRWSRITHDQTIEAQPRYTRDGQALLFTSDHGGIYNLRRMDLASGAVTTLTNLEGGGFYPAEGRSGEIYYTGAGVEGFDIYRLDAPGVVATTTPAAPAGPSASVIVDTPLPDAEVAGIERAYTPWRTLVPRWWFPHLYVDEQIAEVGAVTSGWDALRRHLYGADIAYDFENHWSVGSLDYVYDRWGPVFKLHAGRTVGTYRDINDDPLYLRREDDYQAEVVFPFLRLDRSLSFHMAAVLDREKEAPLQPGVVVAPPLKDPLVGVAVLYDSTRHFPRSVSRSHGRELRLVAETSDALGQGDFSGEIYTLDWREFLSLGGEQVLSFRLAGGWGTKAPRPFELGGARGSSQPPYLLMSPFLNNPFNEREYPLRGYDENDPALTGRRMVLASLEYRFPVYRLQRGSMTPPIGLHHVFGTAFIETGDTWNAGDHPREYHSGAGLEAHAVGVLFYGLGLHLRTGVAYGFDRVLGETKVYIEAGSAF